MSGIAWSFFENPMHRGQKFQPEGGLEALDQIGDFFETGTGLRVFLQKGSGFFLSPRHQPELFCRPIASIGIAGDKMSFDDIQDMTKVFRIGTIGSLAVGQPQRFTGLLHEVEQFMDLKKGYDGVKEPLKVTPHQPYESSPTSSHGRFFTAMNHGFRLWGSLWFVKPDVNSRQ